MMNNHRLNRQLRIKAQQRQKGTDSNPSYTHNQDKQTSVHIGTQPTDVAQAIQKNGWQGDLDNLWKMLLELEASSASMQTVLEEIGYSANRALGAIQRSQGITLSDQATMNTLSNLRQNINLYRKFIKEVNFALPRQNEQVEQTTEYSKY